jgi:hypothetical protein
MFIIQATEWRKNKSNNFLSQNVSENAFCCREKNAAEKPIVELLNSPLGRHFHCRFAIAKTQSKVIAEVL